MTLNLSYQTKLNRATLDTLPEIYNHFYNCREWFPHIRKDYVERNILANKVIYDKGIIIIFNQYQRRQKIGTVEAQRGDHILHQILNSDRDSGTNYASAVLQQFCVECSSDVYLSVRADNIRATKFYSKNGFKLVGTTSWMNGSLPGLVFLHSLEK
jgi:RimJ/RimL family protein N-acetyltransferase